MAGVFATEVETPLSGQYHQSQVTIRCPVVSRKKKVFRPQNEMAPHVTLRCGAIFVRKRTIPVRKRTKMAPQEFLNENLVNSCIY